ncbi:hypothetical protein NDU88_001427 [Pleurodeles waltl]|uniref:Uncharacterized protein n=1 Tax=Pleurodeles waltl TaxID=8319 RepID=A0AAV7R8J1_PLEWA|nr:hypothetical protein NDU88_001427 [Pleurodeles waltl]
MVRVERALQQRHYDRPGPASVSVLVSAAFAQRASRSSARGLGPPPQLRVSQCMPHVLHSAAGRAASRNSSEPGLTAGPFCTTYFGWPPFTTTEVRATRPVHGFTFASLARLRFCNGLLGPNSRPRTPWVVNGVYP